MNSFVAFFAVIFSSAVVFAAPSAEHENDLKVSADKMAADNVTGALVASGNVVAVSAPFRMFSDCVSKVGNVYSFNSPTTVTTCTNDTGCLHWSLSGSLVYEHGKEAVAKDMLLRFFGIPVAWVPYWWQPFDTDYGWRVMPGYRSRWGAFLMTKYVYDIAGDYRSGEGVRGATRFDLRTKNGVAAGQSLNWKLGDFGEGKFKVYYAHDEDADRYSRWWNNSTHHNYGNWESEIPDNRYMVELAHKVEATERDSIWVNANIHSDTRFAYDFMRSGTMRLSNPYRGVQSSELAWEHLGDTFGAGVSVSGPLSDFYPGISRLPEFYINAMPQPVLFLPVNYESSSRLGWLNRNYAVYGDEKTDQYYRYFPGVWADYQAFRADTYHRLTAPFKIADIVSVVPRAGVRGTYWSASGLESIDGRSRAGLEDDDVVRSIVEGGITFAARGTAPIFETWQHVLEPYFDVLAQKADYSGLDGRRRALYFDSFDGSADWLDQFAGRSRNLPYSWYGFTPGIRNAFRTVGDDGRLRTVADFDVYAAVQCNDTSWTAGDRYHQLSLSQDDPNYGRDGEVLVSPGFRARVSPDETTMLRARVEWDGQNDTVAFADVEISKRFSKSFAATVLYASRDHRYWDFSSSPFKEEIMRNESFNWAKYSYVGVELEHELCDAIAWGPFLRWDAYENELDEAGAWLDIRTDCLAFRFSLSYENDYVRVDGSEYDHDWNFCFGVYLRALGADAGSMFGD